VTKQPTPVRGGVIIAGGGTAGHLVPGLAIAEALIARGTSRGEIHFVGSTRGLETTMVPEAGFGLTVLSGRGINERRLNIANVRSAVGILQAIVKGIRLVRRARPRAVVSLGGYASLPGAIGAVITRTPLVIAEQNARASLSNRLVARWAKASSVPVPGTGLRREVVTGNPVRPEAVAAAGLDPSEARRSMGWPTDATVILVFGGSLGARRINQAVWSAAPRLLAAEPSVQIHHAVGSRDWPDLPPEMLSLDRYHAVEYEYQLELAMAGADLALCRAGGSTVSELAVTGLPAMLVPLPIAPNDHQTANAAALVNAGAAVLIPDEDLDGDRVIGETLAILGDEQHSLADRRSAARLVGHPDAADRVAQLVETYARSEQQ
jgi:UDP-N-acetylglucosamine--N-acetylmuramyl-(pentapeptide) pyrophosphoryl-undecaprenol N-acetylglucosamine transferase